MYMYSNLFCGQDHVTADMNACCTHLLGFFKSKWKVAEAQLIRHRLQQQQQRQQEEQKTEKEEEERMSELSEKDSKAKKKKKKDDMYLGEEGEVLFQKEFEEMMRQWGMDEETVEAAKRVCFPSFSLWDAVIIRKHFHEVGKKVLDLDYAFFSEKPKDEGEQNKVEAAESKEEEKSEATTTTSSSKEKEDETQTGGDNKQQAQRDTNRGRKRKALRKQAVGQGKTTQEIGRAHV